MESIINKSTPQLVAGDIAEMHTDAIVNAANAHPGKELQK